MKRLRRLLRPESIAVVGGGAWCEAVVQCCKRSGFAGPIWPVHPKRERIVDLPVYGNVNDLPGTPDAAFVGVNRQATIDVVQALRDRKSGGAVCFASGFKEASDGADLQTALLEAAGNMPLLGPNCYGFVNALDGAALWPDMHGLKPVDRGVAIIGQSSNVLLNLSMQRRGLPIAYLVAAGNQASVGMAAIGRDLLDDRRVTALGLHVEGFGDIRAFEDLAAHAEALGKPIVVLKAGRSVEAQRATLSHTASLAGSDAGAAALIERLGMVRAKGLNHFLTILTSMHLFGRRRFERIASLSCSGGEASLIADGAEGLPLTFPPLADQQREALRGQLGEAISLANPLDYHTAIWRDADAMRDVFAAMTGETIDITCLVLDYPRSDRCDPADWGVALDALIAAKGKSGGTFALVASLPENLPEEVAERAIASGILPLFGLDDALEGLASTGEGKGGRVVRPVLLGRIEGTPITLSEHEAKTELAAFGLKLPKALRTVTADEAAACAVEIGFPVVLKGEGAAHKSEAGLVRLDLSNERDVEAAARAMATDGFLIETMVSDAIAEMLIGVLHDPAHGYVLTLAAGGTLTELQGDSTSLLMPASRREVEAALSRLRIAKLLFGYRGGPGVNMVKLLDAVDAVQAYVAERSNSVVEVEVNPLLVTAADAIAVDVLIVRTT